jgi:alkylhydroperoxidase family enzyme
MARVKGVFKPSDYPGTPDAATKKDLDALFAHMFPGDAKPEMSAPHYGYALFAQNPALALNIAKLADYIVREMPWSQRRDLREIVVQALNLYYKCDFSFLAHLPIAEGTGISLAQQAAIPYWRTTNVFDDEQRLLIEYSLAVCSGDVPEELFARIVKQYGEKGAVECTTTIGWWAFWAMFLNAIRPEFTSERAQPLPGDARELPGNRKG